MGPRPRGRGNMSGPRKRSVPGSLQWGHGHVAVEILRTTSHRRRKACFNGATATWPWKCGFAGWVARGRQASMGPRPRGRGNSTTGGVLVDADGLQWGHGHVAVEIREHYAALRSQNQLQWGHGHVAVEMTVACLVHQPLPSFNGATATWPWKWGECCKAVGDALGFNGATATWPWKCSTVASKGTGSAASMGPRPRGRGNDRGCRVPGSDLPASMGPRPRGRGNDEPFLSHAFNHLASMGPRPRGRGNMTVSWTFQDYCKLQWGHGHVAVEMRNGESIT